MDLHNAFAASILSADTTAARFRACGVRQTASDIILGAWIEWRACALAVGHDKAELATVEAGLIEWDGDVPRARVVAANVVAFGSRPAE